MYLLSVATDPYQYECMMIGLLAKKLKYTFIVCGINEPWKGWPTKMKCYADQLKSIAEKEPDALCICADGYDTLPLRNGEDFEKEFLKFNANIVVSSENHCGGNCRKLTNYVYEKDAKFKHVNAGLLGGKAINLFKMWTHLYDAKYKDDQIGLSEYIDNKSDNIVLDTKGELFFNSGLAFGYDESHFLPQQYLYGKHAFVVHFPGLNFFSSQQVNYKNALQSLLQFHKLDHVLQPRSPLANSYLLYLFTFFCFVWALLATYYCLKTKIN